jgi:hypothetical protein
MKEDEPEKDPINRLLIAICRLSVFVMLISYIMGFYKTCGGR